MTVTTERTIISEGSFENYLLELLSYPSSNSSNYDNLSLRYKSLLFAGYSITLKNEIEEFLSNGMQIPNENLIDILITLCEAYEHLNDAKNGKKVVNRIYELLTKIDLNEKEEIQIFLFKTDIFKCIFNPSDKMVDSLPLRLEDLFTNEELVSDYVKILKSYFLRKLAKIFMYRYEFSRAIEYLELSFNNNQNNDFCKAENKFQIGTIDFFNGRYEEAIKNFEISANISYNLGNLNNYSSALIYISNCNFLNGDFVSAEKTIIQALETKKIFKNDLIELKAITTLGEIHFHKGNMDISYNDYFLKAKKEFEKNNLLHCIAEINNKIARLKASEGNFDRSKFFLKKGLNYYRVLENTEGIRRSMSFLGYCYFEMGDLESAISIWLELEIIYKDSKNYKIVGYNYLNIAKYYLISNDKRSIIYYKRAINIFTEINHVEGLIESYLGYSLALEDHKEEIGQIKNIFSKTKELIDNLKGNYAIISERIYLLCLIAIEYSFDETKEYIDLELPLLNKLTPNKRVNQRFDFLHAVKLKNTNRLKDAIMALELFEKIISEPEIIDFQTTILSYLNILEFRIFELKITEKPEILFEINIILEELYTLTSTNKLSAWSAKTLALRSQLKLLELNFDEAKKSLATALIIAKQSNLKRLVLLFNNQYDNLLTKINQLTSKEHQNDSLSERMNVTNFKVFDTKINSESELSKEEPSYLSIICSSGISLYSNNFSNPKGENFDQLMSGFLIAINSVILKLFSSSGFIERIKHKEYNIMILQFTDSLYICYAYKGSSYSAEMRIENIKNTLSQNIILNGLIEASSKKKTLNSVEIERLDLLLKNLFKST